jgi:P27 family predicted phage terminase small subunit
MPSGGIPEPIEKKAMKAKGDGVTPGHKRVSPPGTAVVVQGSITSSIAFPHDKLPEMPAHLGKRGQVEWFKIWDNGPWLHPEEDYRWVEMICEAYDEIESFREEIKVVGLMIKNYAGADTANPLIGEIRKAQALIMKCLSVLGYSPSDRARLGLAEIKVQSGLADLQSKTQENRQRS